MPVKNPGFMAGVPELLVLGLLAGREMYGYEIARSIKAASRDAFSLGEGVLYPVLHTMESRGLVRTRSARVEGRVRIYYSLTAQGKKRLGRLRADWRRMSIGVDSILGNPSHG
jgi:PadR family transcriptional regulator, regulatory protein PadR